MAKAYKPKGFARRLQKMAGNVKKQQNEIKREYAVEVLTQIVGDTPIRTGRAKDSWNTSIGAANISIPSGPYGGRGPTGSGIGAITRGRNLIRSGAVTFGKKIFIASGLPYMARLNDGYSSQAPSKFVQIALARGIGIVRRQLRRYAGKIFET